MLKFVTSAAFALFALASAAHAQVTFTSTPFDSGVPAGETLVEDFDSAISAGYAFNYGPSGALMDDSIVGYAVAPAQDGTHYAVVPEGDMATFTSQRGLRSASVYLGSIDPYNTITFLDNNTVVASFTGSQLVDNPDGNQHDGAMNRLFVFNFGAQPINEIEFSSSGYSFEFDNIAVSPAPEPQTWTLLIIGVALVGLAVRASRSRAPADGRGRLALDC